MNYRILKPGINGGGHVFRGQRPRLQLRLACTPVAAVGDRGR